MLSTELSHRGRLIVDKLCDQMTAEIYEAIFQFYDLSAHQGQDQLIRNAEKQLCESYGTLLLERESTLLIQRDINTPTLERPSTVSNYIGGEGRNMIWKL